MRRMCGLASAAIAAGIVAALALALAAPVTPARGRDEIDFAHLSNIALPAGQVYDQSLDLQAPGLSYVDFPYRLLGKATATVDVRISASDGQTLASRRLQLAPTTPRLTPVPGLSGSFWDGQQAGIASVATAAPTGGKTTITVRLQRTDDGAEPVILYIEDPASADGKPPLAEVPRVAIVFFTRYEAAEPVAAKLQLYANRLGGLSSAWPGGAFPALAALALLLAVVLVAGIGLSAGEEAGRKREQPEERVDRP